MTVAQIKQKIAEAEIEKRSLVTLTECTPAISNQNYQTSQKKRKPFRC